MLGNLSRMVTYLGYDDLFAPYFNPKTQPNVTFSYKNSMANGSWSKFNPAFKDNDATEYDLYFCINRNDKDGKLVYLHTLSCHFITYDV